MKSKISSFTLVEITVALLISGIIVSILFRFFFFLSSYKHDRTKSSSELTEISIAKKMLLKSFSGKQDEIITSEFEIKVNLSEELKEGNYHIQTYTIHKGIAQEEVTIHRKISELEKWDLETKNNR